MTRYERVNVIAIDDDAKVIQFRKEYQEKKCDHHSVTIREGEDTITCNQCDAVLNPIKWITLHLSRINNALESARERLAKAEVIEEKLQKKNSFMCKHCHEPNTIDFHRLPSATAVKRRMAVIDQDNSDNYQVEIVK